MTAFLDNSSNTDAYGKQHWGQSAVHLCWRKIKERDRKPLDALISTELRESWSRVLWVIARREIERGKFWVVFSDAVWSFCLAAGCPKADRGDPFKSFEALRDLVGRQLAYTADLYNKISELSKQIILQQRMITALAYRDVLENLSATTEGRTQRINGTVS